MAQFCNFDLFGLARGFSILDAVRTCSWRAVPAAARARKGPEMFRCDFIMISFCPMSFFLSGRRKAPK
eukprot:4697935-Amphidinium_carterae.1